MIQAQSLEQGAGARRLPVVWIGQRLAVSRAEAMEMVGMKDTSFWLFCNEQGIAPIHGAYVVKDLERGFQRRQSKR